jgi:undecaprenyl-diphosphatase
LSFRALPAPQLILDHPTPVHAGRPTCVCSDVVTHRVFRLSTTTWLAIGATLALVSAVAFLGLADVVAADHTRVLDETALRWLAAHRTAPLTGLFIAASALGSWPFISTLTLGLCIAGALRGARRAAVSLAIAVLGIPVLIVLLKPFYARPRPSVVAHLDWVDSASFPSGHALAASIFFGTLALLAAQQAPHDGHRAVLVTLALIAIALVALSRMYLGVHYPSDVLGGVLVGTTWSLFVLLGAQLSRSR